jgi:hypothetical protein
MAIYYIYGNKIRLILITYIDLRVKKYIFLLENMI